jgi:prefoldin subunit 5
MKNKMDNLEKERSELQQICRELLLLDGDIEKLEKKINRIEERRNNLYLEIDKKLDEG